jgi:PTS system nitrogen regulatory IIA component
MDLLELLSVENIRLRVSCSGKADLLRKLCAAAATATRLDPATVETLITEREALGSTGVGAGLALPHARVPGLDRPFLLLATLAHAIKYESIDDQPVDLIAFLLTPKANSTELNALACVSRALRVPAIRSRLRKSTTPQDAIGVLRDQVSSIVS